MPSRCPLGLCEHCSHVKNAQFCKFNACFKGCVLVLHSQFMLVHFHAGSLLCESEKTVQVGQLTGPLAVLISITVHILTGMPSKRDTKMSVYYQQPRLAVISTLISKEGRIVHLFKYIDITPHRLHTQTHEYTIHTQSTPKHPSRSAHKQNTNTYIRTTNLRKR